MAQVPSSQSSRISAHNDPFVLTTPPWGTASGQPAPAAAGPPQQPQQQPQRPPAPQQVPSGQQTPGGASAGGPRISALSDPFVLSTPPHPSTTPQGQSPGGAAGAAAAGGPGSVAVGPDPFMTRARPVRISQDDVVVMTDPFMLHTRPGAGADVGNDPFLTHHPGLIGHHSQRDVSAKGSSRATTTSAVEAAAMTCCEPCISFGEGLSELLGHTDPMASTWRGQLYVYLPFAIFLTVVLLIFLLRNFVATVTWFLIGLLGSASLTLLLAGLFGGRMRGAVSPVTLGSLCLVAVGLGILAGEMGWRYASVRQSWWMSRGFHYAGVTASSDARSMKDASVIDFNIRNTSTSVDHRRSAGYVEGGGDHYCVAPVLDNFTASSKNRVQFWAIGKDCCDSLGDFHCDDSRKANANSGIVMVDDGYPCPGCDSGKFAKAVAKAEASFDLISVKGAVMVRWVSDAGAFRRWLVARIVLYFFMCCLLGFLLLAALGHAANCYGWGYTPPEATHLLQQPDTPRKTGHRRA